MIGYYIGIGIACVGIAIMALSVIANIVAQEKELKCVIFNDGTTAVIQIVIAHPQGYAEGYSLCEGHGEAIAFFVSHGYTINSTNNWEVIMTR